MDNNKKLIEACKLSNLEGVKELANEGADINFKDENGDTPLYIACKNSDIKLFKLLLELKVDDLDLSDAFGYYSPWEYVMLKTNMRFAKVFADRVAPFYRENILAKEISSKARAKLIFNYIDPQDTDFEEENLYLKACKTGNNVIITALKEIDKLDVNQVNISGETGIILAIRNGKFKTVKLLCELGADLDIKDKRGCNAITYASIYQEEEIKEYLLSVGAEW